MHVPHIMRHIVKSTDSRPVLGGESLQWEVNPRNWRCFAAMRVPDWRLPPGVTRALWEYVHEPRIAQEYDCSLVSSGLVQFDETVVTEAFHLPGKLIDLGCGTGRL